MLAEHETEEWTAADLIEVIGEPSGDAMGRGHILYWPAIPWLEEWKEGD